MITVQGNTETPASQNLVNLPMCSCALIFLRCINFLTHINSSTH